jgi:hypothetical protein
MKQKKLIEDEVTEEVSSTEEYVYEDDFTPPDSTAKDQQYLKASTAVEDENYVHLAALNDLVYEVFHKSRWSALGPNKKIPKDLIPFVFQDLLEAMEQKEFTIVEKFVSICDFMNVAYLKAYELIHMKYKELIVNEMDQKFGIVSKKKIKKIF